MHSLGPFSRHVWYVHAHNPPIAVSVTDDDDEDEDDDSDEPTS